MDVFINDIADNKEEKTLTIDTGEEVVANVDQFRSTVYYDHALAESHNLNKILRRCKILYNPPSPSMISTHHGFASNEPPAADPDIYPNHPWARIKRWNILYDESDATWNSITHADEYAVAVPTLTETMPTVNPPINYNYYRSARIEPPTADPDIFPNYGGRITSAPYRYQPPEIVSPKSTAGLSMS